MAYQTQAQKRRPQKMKDNHGRPWFATVEKASGYPSGPIKPKFRVPHLSLIPPQKYLDIADDNPAQLTINYDKWIADLEAANREWDANRLRLGRAISGEAFDPKKPSTMELTVLLGPKPMSPEPVRAMRQGNKWALGFSDVKPKEAETYFPVSAVAADTPVWSGETWTEPVEAKPISLAEVEARVPTDLRGFAREKWILAELRKSSGVAEAQEA